MSGATFDTGMLVALDRNEREAWVALRRLVNRGEVPTIPTVVTAQAWRDGRRQSQLARALRDCRPESLDDESARRAGELCRRSRTSDVVDAAVIVSAGRATTTCTRETPATWSTSPNTSPARLPSSRSAARDDTTAGTLATRSLTGPHASCVRLQRRPPGPPRRCPRASACAAST